MKLTGYLSLLVLSSVTYPELHCEWGVILDSQIQKHQTEGGIDVQLTFNFSETTTDTRYSFVDDIDQPCAMHNFQVHASNAAGDGTPDVINETIPICEWCLLSLTCEGALLGRSHTSVRPVAVETRFRLPGGSGRSEEGRRTMTLIMNRKISWKF